MKPDVYKTCPIYETENLILRLVQQEDAKDLLDCYSDKDAITLMNSDECANNFYYSNVTEMLSTIDFWLSEYKKGLYVRFSIIEKTNNKAIGTVEFFDEEFPELVDEDGAGWYYRHIHAIADFISANRTKVNKHIHCLAERTKQWEAS